MAINLRDYDPALMQGAELSISSADISIDDLAVADDAAIGGDLAVTGTLAAGATTITGATGITGAATITSASASSLAVGLNGATTPAFSVDSSTGSQAAGLKVTGATTTGTVAVETIGGAAVNLTVNAKGTGTIGIGSVSTGAVTITPATTVTGLLSATAAGVRTFQAVTNVHDTTPTQAEMVTAFGAVPGRGFIGTIDDNDGNAISYLCWSTDASYYFVIGTKGA